MLTHEQYLTKSQQYRTVKLTFNSQLFQLYEVTLPETTPLKILIADVTDWASECFEGEVLHNGSCLIIEKVKEVWRWVYKLAIIKKMAQIGSGQKLETQVMSDFDGLYWNCNNEWYGMHAVQSTAKLTQISNKLPQELMFRSYRLLLAEYHSFNIVFDGIESDCCLWDVERRRALVRLGQDWRNVEYEQGHRYWVQLREDPFTNDFEILRKTIADIYSQKETAKQYSFQFNKEGVLRAGELLSVIYYKSFGQFKDKYKQSAQKQISFRENPTLFTKLRQFYTLRANNMYLNELLQLAFDEQRGQLIRSPWKNWKMFEIVLELKYLKFRHQFANSLANGSIFEEVKKAMSLDDPYFVQRTVFGVPKRQNIDKIAKMMPRNTKEGRIRWHFLQSKIQWKSGNFYRSLAHLRQAKNQTTESKLLHVIALEQGRNWQQLGFADKAEHFYNESTAFGEEIYGTSHYMLLPNYYNLKLMYCKQGNMEKGQEIEQKIKKIKEVHALSKIKKTSELLFGRVVQHFIQSYVVLDDKDNKEKTDKVITKSEALKLQGERIPYLQSLWKCFKSVLQQLKHEKHASYSQIIKNFELQGQTKSIVYFLKLVGQLLGHPQYKLTVNEVCDILESLDIMKVSNLKNYHRFIFLLGFYFEEQDTSLSIQYMETILQAKNLYPKSIRFSLVKRLAQLYKKQNKTQQLLKLYNSENIQFYGDVQSVFQWIFLCSEKGKHTEVIKLGLWYLKNTKCYETGNDNEIIRQNLEASVRVKLAMMTSYVELRCFVQIQKLLEEVECDCFERQGVNVKFLGVLEDICGMVYQMGQFGLCLLLLRKIVCRLFKQEQQQKIMDDGQQFIQKAYYMYLDLRSKVQIKYFQVQDNWLKGKVVQTSNLSQNSNNSSLQVLDGRIQRDQQQLVAKNRVSMTSIFSQLSKELKQVSPNFQALFSSFNILLAQIDSYSQLFQAIIAQIQKIAKTQGIRSSTANILHILLLNISHKHGLKMTQMHLLYWLKAFKLNFTLPEHLNQHWVSKQGRDLRLDQLLSHYFQNQMPQNESQHDLDEISWFHEKRDELVSLKDDYRSVLAQILGEDDQKLQIKIVGFKIKYCSIFDASLEESQVFEKLDEIMGQLECPQQEL